MRLSLAIQAVIAAWEAGEVPLLIGEPGIGKSEGVFQAAKQVRRKVHVVKNLVMDDPTEFKGYGMPDFGAGVTKILPMRWAHELNSQEPGVIFADELGQALQSTMCATAPMFQRDPLGRRRIGEMYVEVDHYFAAATNRKEDRSCVNTLPDFFMRRLIDIPVDFSFDDWEAWAVRNNIHPFILAYGRLKADKIHQYVPGRRSPLAASWSKVSLVESGNADVEVKRVLTQGIIGPEATCEYWELRDRVDKLPNLSLILQGKPNVKVPDSKPLQYLVVCILATRVNHKTLGNALHYLDQYPGELRNLFKDDVLARDPGFATHDAILEYHSKYGNKQV